MRDFKLLKVKKYVLMNCQSLGLKIIEKGVLKMTFGEVI